MDLQPDDVVTFETPGGGGLGPPGKRDAAMLRDDLQSGLVTPEGVRAYRSAVQAGDARGD